MKMKLISVVANSLAVIVVLLAGPPVAQALEITLPPDATSLKPSTMPAISWLCAIARPAMPPNTCRRSRLSRTRGGRARSER